MRQLLRLTATARVVQPPPLFLLLCLIFFCHTSANPAQEMPNPSSSSGKARLTFSEWRRVADAPILSPQGNTWESAGTFNPAVIFLPQTPVPASRKKSPASIGCIGLAPLPTAPIRWVFLPRPT